MKPASIVLDLLHSHTGHAGSVRSIMRAGSLFGCSENTMRVTLCRLLSRGQLESPRRGYYRLAANTSALNYFVDEWRLGETRCRAWEPGQWLVCHRSGPTGSGSGRDDTNPHSSSDRGCWALESRGFRQVRQNFWARPDNLAVTLEQLTEQLVALGLEVAALVMGPCSIQSKITEHWQQAWNTQVLSDRYHQALQALTDSANRLDALPREQAMLESFKLGGDVIQLLAKDPLLPQSWLDTSNRQRLWQAMLRYDERGKAVWAEPEQHSPAQLPRPQQPLALQQFQ